MDSGPRSVERRAATAAIDGGDEVVDVERFEDYIDVKAFEHRGLTAYAVDGPGADDDRYGRRVWVAAKFLQQVPAGAFAVVDHVIHDEQVGLDALDR